MKRESYGSVNDTKGRCDELRISRLQIAAAFGVLVWSVVWSVKGIIKSKVDFITNAARKRPRPSGHVTLGNNVVILLSHSLKRKIAVVKVIQIPCSASVQTTNRRNHH